ncbi:MAG: bifunctional indole-3-glycerol phosphate synthase/phosphoribosylanthranilate isomerase, partial [Planctomycetes bacterium]|nr:bifunctional indole-3-glycerol phosphate synthase/phosphoribosylanthranilate isomerase [Planctomycetota bacterium]
MKKKNIRDEIVEQRRARLAETGFSEGVSLPDRREAPIVPFLGSNGLICEVKRRSPSRGPIAEGLD